MNKQTALKLRPGDLVLVGTRLKQGTQLTAEQRERNREQVCANSANWLEADEAEVVHVTPRGGVLVIMPDGREKWLAYSHVQCA
jgi:hypothetical protein